MIKYIFSSEKHVTNLHVPGCEKLLGISFSSQREIFFFLFGTQKNVAIFKMLNPRTEVNLKDLLYLFLTVFIRSFIGQYYVVREDTLQGKASSVKAKDQSS